MAGTGGKDLVARSVPDTGHAAVPSCSWLTLLVACVIIVTFVMIIITVLGSWRPSKIHLKGGGRVLFLDSAPHHRHKVSKKKILLFVSTTEPEQQLPVFCTGNFGPPHETGGTLTPPPIGRWSSP